MLRAIGWILLGTGSVAAILYGVHRNRPAQRSPWLLLAGAVAALCVGDVLYEYELMDLAEVFYLAMYPLVVISLLRFTRDGSLLADRARLIDLLAFSCSTLLVVWAFVIGSSGQFGAVSAADVIGGLLLVGVAIRLIVADRRNVAAYLLLTGSLGLLAGDVFYPLTGGSPVAESAFVVLYLGWGLSALHPSMVRLTEPRPPEPTPFRLHWTLLLAASAATPPAVLLIEALSGEVRDGVVIAVTGAVTLLLCITRLADAIRQHSAALSRERGLRTANTALVAAADLPAVDTAVRTAIARLLPPGTVRRIVLATDDGKLAAASVPPAPAGAGSRSWFAPADDRDECVLVCPLRLEPLAVARPSGGALILTGAKEALMAGRDSLEVLAGEAALALDRITLVEAVGRRDSDLYLRAVIRNTAEIMAVVDSDHRIRYASPGLRDLIGGEELPPLTALDDLVHPDDQALVRVKLRAEGDGRVFCALRRKDETQAFVEMTYRDLREDRLVQGLVVTIRDVTDRHDPLEGMPYADHAGDMPAWVNRRSAQHKFRY
ncbi:PAS domain S-box protein [Actinoplanes sp. NPDC023714]|uniref:PAS domain S-box protein n=1 Tax=Actinoplanes sp. NPDC023714 TaxID=3154322 RepID=UPI0033DE5CA1